VTPTRVARETEAPRRHVASTGAMPTVRQAHRKGGGRTGTGAFLLATYRHPSGSRTWAPGVEARKAAALTAGPVLTPQPGGLSGLAEIEQRVVLGLARGQSATEIADSLGITALGARVLIKRAYAALGVRSKAQLLARLDGNPIH
jgi:DNA-binding CsgD family transcriptional regulator